MYGWFCKPLHHCTGHGSPSPSNLALASDSVTVKYQLEQLRQVCGDDFIPSQFGVVWKDPSWNGHCISPCLLGADMHCYVSATDMS